MRLRITTPLDTVIDEVGVLVLSAEDASGCFGIQPCHADFLTSLVVSVVSWCSADGGRHYCAVRGGVLTVTGRSSSGCQELAIATREAIPGDDLAHLDRDIVTQFDRELEADRGARVDSTRLQLNAIRQIVRHLQPGGPGSGDFS